MLLVFVDYFIQAVRSFCNN